MRRHLWTLALTGLFAGLVLTTDASACCHKKKCAPAPCAVVTCPAPAPCPAPEPCPPRNGCCGKRKLFSGCFQGFKGFKLCKKKQVCATPVVCATPAPVIV